MGVDQKFLVTQIPGRFEKDYKLRTDKATPRPGITIENDARASYTSGSFGVDDGILNSNRFGWSARLTGIEFAAKSRQAMKDRVISIVYRAAVIFVGVAVFWLWYRREAVPSRLPGAAAGHHSVHNVDTHSKPQYVFHQDAGVIKAVNDIVTMKTAVLLKEIEEIMKKQLAAGYKERPVASSSPEGEGDKQRGALRLKQLSTTICSDSSNVCTPKYCYSCPELGAVISAPERSGEPSGGFFDSHFFGTNYLGKWTLQNSTHRLQRCRNGVESVFLTDRIDSVSDCYVPVSFPRNPLATFDSSSIDYLKSQSRMSMQVRFPTPVMLTEVTLKYINPMFLAKEDIGKFTVAVWPLMSRDSSSKLVIPTGAEASVFDVSYDSGEMDPDNIIAMTQTVPLLLSQSNIDGIQIVIHGADPRLYRMMFYGLRH